MSLICDISNFRVVCVGVLFVCLVSFLTLTPLTPKGLLVDFREQQAVGVEKSPWTETISVYVDSRKRIPGEWAAGGAGGTGSKVEG
jgi:hypothetical protein